MYCIWYLISTFLIILYLRKASKVWTELYDKHKKISYNPGDKAIEEYPDIYAGYIPFVYDMSSYGNNYLRRPATKNTFITSICLLCPVVREIILFIPILILLGFSFTSLVIKLITNSFPWDE